MLNRRDFMTLGALAVAGCGTIEVPQARNARPEFAPNVTAKPSAPPPPPKPRVEFHAFSKMFQPPVCKDYDATAELLAKAGFDGIEWTVRPNGHVSPERAKEDLPKAVAAARKQGLKSTLLVTAVTDGDDPASEALLKTAADSGFKLFRPGYFFYDLKKESFRASMDRIRRGFASLAKLAERTGLYCAYQNHSSWGPSLFGGLVWDVYEMIRDLDPKVIGMEYDPMHAFYETGLSWAHGLDLVADRIGAICLKDFHFVLSKKDEKNHAKFMCPAGKGVVPWKEVKLRLDANKVKAPFTVHFEHNLAKDDLVKDVKADLDFFKGVFA